MAVREGLGDLPIFDTDILPGRQNIMQEEVEEDDYQYITKMYPAIAREILEFIEDLCDRLEYEGSMMFDQYMDRTNVLTMADKVYDKVKILSYVFSYVMRVRVFSHARCAFASRLDNSLPAYSGDRLVNHCGGVECTVCFGVCWNFGITFAVLLISRYSQRRQIFLAACSHFSPLKASA